MGILSLILAGFAGLLIGAAAIFALFYYQGSRVKRKAMQRKKEKPAPQRSQMEDTAEVKPVMPEAQGIVPENFFRDFKNYIQEFSDKYENLANMSLQLVEYAYDSKNELNEIKRDLGELQEKLIAAGAPVPKYTGRTPESAEPDGSAAEISPYEPYAYESTGLMSSPPKPDRRLGIIKKIAEDYNASQDNPRQFTKTYGGQSFGIPDVRKQLTRVSHDSGSYTDFVVDPGSRPFIALFGGGLPDDECYVVPDFQTIRQTEVVKKENGFYRLFIARPGAGTLVAPAIFRFDKSKSEVDTSEIVSKGKLS